MAESTRVGRRWRSTEATRQAVLDAAIDVFSRVSYAEARIGEIVDLSSVSVGSIYHHFGGKAEIFEELWQRYTDALWQAVRVGSAAARAAGERDPIELVVAGACSYLEALSDPSVAALSRIMISGNVPPDFSARMRQEQDKWIRSNLPIFGPHGDIEARLRAAVLVAVLGEAEQLYSNGRDEGSLDVVIEATAKMLRGLLAS